MINILVQTDEKMIHMNPENGILIDAIDSARKKIDLYLLIPFLIFIFQSRVAILLDINSLNNSHFRRRKWHL